MTDRRAFLRGLAALPLIGGSVALIGAPSAVAEPTTPLMAEAYKTWLDMELRCLCWEMAGDPRFSSRYPAAETRRATADTIGRCLAFVGDAGRYHGVDRPQSSSRAALVLSAVGCDWRDRSGLFNEGGRAD